MPTVLDRVAPMASVVLDLVVMSADQIPCLARIVVAMAIVLDLVVPTVTDVLAPAEMERVPIWSIEVIDVVRVAM